MTSLAIKKNIRLLVFICLFSCGNLLFSCKSIPTKSLEGNWETVELLVDGQQQRLLESNIKFTPKDKIFKISGSAGANLYYAFVEIKGNKFFAKGMENTGFYGTDEEMAFEDLFFKAVINANSIEIEENLITLKNSVDNIEIKFERK